MTDEQIKNMELTMWLRGIKPGLVLTEKQYKAVHSLIGEIMDKVDAIEIKSLFSIHFDKNGTPHSLDLGDKAKMFIGDKEVKVVQPASPTTASEGEKNG